MKTTDLGTAAAVTEAEAEDRPTDRPTSILASRSPSVVAVIRKRRSARTDGHETSTGV